MIRCFYPPITSQIFLPCITEIKNATALQGQKLMHGKSASEHNCSGVGCNFRVFQGQITSRVFVGHPVNMFN